MLLRLFGLVLCTLFLLANVGLSREETGNGLFPIPPFNCSSLPTPPPATNVNQLRPGNIKVVMAVGDSISAGFGMHAHHAYQLEDFYSDLFEYRGDVFSIGGNENQQTIPNFLKTYTDDIVGASIGMTLPLDDIYWRNHSLQPWDPKVTHLNGAQSGAVVEDVPAQIEYIIKQLTTTYNTTVDMENDWKMLTIFIGANDVCGACHDDPDSQPDFYYNKLNDVLQQVYEGIPRTFVNIVTMFNISQVYTISHTSEYCRVMWDTICSSECGCMTGDSTPQDRLTMDLTSLAFNQKLYQLADLWQAKNIPTFTAKCSLSSRISPFRPILASSS